jgi:hypothetical protein
LSTDDWARRGDQSLREHLLAQASFAHAKHAPLTLERLAILLTDRDCLRYSVRLIFGFGEMAMHQFAQPGLDPDEPASNRRVLYLRPALQDKLDLIPLAAAYLIPVINYGDIVTDEHALQYGATLLGLTEEEYYQQLCALADLCGAEAKAGDAG